MWHIFWACVWLRCKWWFKRPLELCLLFSIVPLTMLLLVTLIQSVTQQEEVPVAIVDEDQSKYSQLVIDRIAEQPIVSAEIMSKQQAVRLIETNKVEAVFIFKEGFMERLLHEDRSQVVEMLYSPASTISGLLREAVASEVFRLASNGQAAHFILNKNEQLGLLSSADKEAIEQGRHLTSLWQEAWTHSDSYWEPEPLMSIRYLEANRFSQIDQNEEGQETESLALVRYELQLLVGWLSALLLFILIFVQQWLVEEKDNGIQKRLKSTAVSPFLYVVGHAFPAFLFVIFQGVVTLLLIFWRYDFVIPLTLKLFILLFIYIVTAFSLSLWIAISVKTTVQLQVAGIFLVLLTSIVGGSFIDLGEWNSFINLFSYGTPQGLFLNGWKESLRPASENNKVLIFKQSVLPLVVFTLLFVFLSIGRWRK